MSDTEPTTRHAFAPEPLARFVANPTTRETLRDITRSPAFIAAMNYLQEEDRVRPEHLNHMPDLIILRKTAFHAGVASVYERLQALTKNHEPRPEIEGWDHIKPEQP